MIEVATTIGESAGAIGAGSGVRRAGEADRQVVGYAGAGDGAGSGVADDDRVGQAGPRRDGRHAIRLGDCQVALRRERIRISGGAVAGVDVGGSGWRADGGRVAERAGGRRADGAGQQVGDAAADWQIDQLIEVATTIGESAGAIGAGSGVRRAGEADRQVVGYAGAGDGAGSGVADDDRVGQAAPGVTDVTPSVLVIARSPCGVSVSVSMAVLLLVLISVVPTGGLTVAVLLSEPVAVGLTVPVTR